MGLASALSTALTGLTAAETQIDVSGNNLANSQTAGFKASKTVFANQFLQTLGVGSQPTSDSGGTNPRQVGLGVQVAEISPDFSQGTVEISKSPSDLALQGDGFFIVEGKTGEHLYTRNGIFKTNAENELVNVNGNRLLGYGVDTSFAIERTELRALTIPLGAAAVTKATETASLQGALTPTGDVADTAEVIQSAVLGDASTDRPDITASGITAAPTPDVGLSGTTGAGAAGGALTAGATYRYRFVFEDNSGKESAPSNEVVVTLGGAENTVNLASLPTDSSGEYTNIRIYRTAANGATFSLLDTAPIGGAYSDNGSVPLSATPLDTTTIDGNYSYLVTFYRTGFEESRPSIILGPQNVVNNRVLLSNLPSIPVGINPPYNQLRIYRNLSTDSSRFYLVDTINPGSDYTDSATDASISTGSGATELDFDGPKAASNTLLVNLIRRDGVNYERLFDLGTATSGVLSFAGRKGGRALAAKEFTVDSATTLQDLADFMDEAMGIRSVADDPQYAIPDSINNLDASGNLAPGGSINAGLMRFVSNNGVDNALSIGLSSFQFNVGGTVSSPNLGFGAVQTARGQSAVADFIAYDSLGIPINVRVTSVLEARDGSSFTYRWFADSPQNDPAVGWDIAAGTGLVTFDGNGNLISTSNTTVSIDRRNVPSVSPLEFDLDFSQVSGLARESSSLAVSRQDGSPPGTLTNFTIGEDGVIRGQFSNGVTRDLGQIRLARFTNNNGLQQSGQNLFAQGVNSGLAIEEDPGQNGAGSIIAGALELSNTDIGKNLIDLVLASTQYRGNARVITTSQQLLDELLNLRR
jgi:flagellar hook protein FlgE